MVDHAKMFYVSKRVNGETHSFIATSHVLNAPVNVSHATYAKYLELEGLPAVEGAEDWEGYLVIFNTNNPIVGDTGSYMTWIPGDVVRRELPN